MKLEISDQETPRREDTCLTTERKNKPSVLYVLRKAEPKNDDQNRKKTLQLDQSEDNQKQKKPSKKHVLPVPKTKTKFATSAMYGKGCSEMKKQEQKLTSVKGTKNSTLALTDAILKDTEHLIKQFIPCKYEEIKPGIRTPDAMKADMSKVSSCPTENSTKAKAESSHKVEEKEDTFLPCQESKTVDAYKSDASLEYQDCKENLDEESHQSSKSKMIVVCKYDDIKDEILGKSNKEKVDSTSQVVACKYEDIKDEILKKITGSAQKEECKTTDKHEDASKNKNNKTSAPLYKHRAPSRARNFVSLFTLFVKQPATLIPFRLPLIYANFLKHEHPRRGLFNSFKRNIQLRTQLF